MARSSIRPTGLSLTRLSLRVLATALGTVALVLLGWATASAASADDGGDPSPERTTSSLTGLVDDLTGSALAPVTDALSPLTDPVDAAVAPVVEPLRQAVRPITYDVGDVVGRVAAPASPTPAAPSTAPAAPDRDAPGRDTSASATVVPERASTEGPDAAANSAGPHTSGAARSATLPADRVEAGHDTTSSSAPHGSGTSHDRQVDVGDLDFGPGSPLLAAWALAEHGAVTGTGFVGPMPLGTHVGADDTLVAVLGSTDHDRTSQNSTRPDVSPG